MKKIGKNTKLYLIGMIIGGITLGITTVIADTIINSTSVAYKTTTVKAALDELYDIADFKEEVKDMLYPVGSIYISVSSTNPSELFGGTWVSFGGGRTLVGVGQGKDDNGLVYTYSDSEYAAGEYTHTLTTDQMPSHAHSKLIVDNTKLIWKSYSLTPGSVIHWFLTTGSDDPDRIYTGSSGGGQSFNVCQPLITVYMWKRTA